MTETITLITKRVGVMPLYKLMKLKTLCMDHQAVDFGWHVSISIQRSLNMIQWVNF